MINRTLNKDIGHSKLRLHSSERNSSWYHIFEDFKNRITDRDIRYYPNVENTYNRLREFYKYENIILGFGSDRCIKYFFEVTKCKNLIITNPTFPMYNVYSEMFNMNTITVDYTTTKFPYEEFKNSIVDDSIIVLSNPVSPIGNLLSMNYIREILDFDVPTLIDEAYIEFTESESVISLLNEYDNLYVTRTFSKALGSAGMRIGVLLSQKQNIDDVTQYRDMYETTGLTVKWIDTVLDYQDEIDKYIESVKSTRFELINLLKKNNIEYIYSNTNWVHIRGNFNIPTNIILKQNCEIPRNGGNWIRLTITNDITDYKWLQKQN